MKIGSYDKDVNASSGGAGKDEMNALELFVDSRSERELTVLTAVLEWLTDRESAFVCLGDTASMMDSIIFDSLSQLSVFCHRSHGE